MIAVVWTFWIAPILVIGAILTIAAIVAGYLSTVTAKQYPPRSQRKKK
jgi:hypothetical protein